MGSGNWDASRIKIPLNTVAGWDCSQVTYNRAFLVSSRCGAPAPSSPPHQSSSSPSPSPLSGPMPEGGLPPPAGGREPSRPSPLRKPEAGSDRPTWATFASAPPMDSHWILKAAESSGATTASLRTDGLMARTPQPRGGKVGRESAPLTAFIVGDRLGGGEVLPPPPTFMGLEGALQRGAPRSKDVKVPCGERALGRGTGAEAGPFIHH